MAEVKEQIVLTPKDLADTDFVIKDKKVHLIISKYSSTVNLSRYYQVADASKENDRKSVRSVNGLMLIHLDIIAKPDAKRTDWIGTLPNDCPTFSHLVEAKKDGVKFYVDPGDRQIFAIGAKPNVNYTIDLLGFIV